MDYNGNGGFGMGGGQTGNDGQLRFNHNYREPEVRCTRGSVSLQRLYVFFMTKRRHPVSPGSKH